MATCISFYLMDFQLLTASA